MGVYRDILIRPGQTFEDLQQMILKSYEFDNKHQSTYYRSNDHWKRGRQIVPVKYEIPYKAEPLIMSETTIGSEIRDPNQKFIFLYDFEKEWTFYLEVIAIRKEAKQEDTPVCIRSVGIGPSQYGTKENVQKKTASDEEKFNYLQDEMTEDYDEDDKIEGDSAGEDEADEGDSDTEL